MNQDAIRTDSLRDGSHPFRALPDNELKCLRCGKPRWSHVDDGFRPKPSRPPSHEHLLYCWKSNYRAHPGWTRPGSFRTKRDQEEKE